MKRRNPRRKLKQLDKRSKQNASEVKNRNPIPARVWPTNKHRRLLVYGKRVFSKRSKIHDKKKIGNDEETKRQRKTHGTKKRRSKCSRGRVKLKMSKEWTKQKCHSAGQRNLDDDDDDDNDDDGDDLESVSELHGRYLIKPVSYFS